MHIHAFELNIARRFRVPDIGYKAGFETSYYCHERTVFVYQRKVLPVSKQALPF